MGGFHMYHSSKGDFVGFLEGKLKINAINNNLNLTMNITCFQFVALWGFGSLFPGFGFVTLLQLLIVTEHRFWSHVSKTHFLIFNKQMSLCVIHLKYYFLFANHGIVAYILPNTWFCGNSVFVVLYAKISRHQDIFSVIYEDGQIKIM